MSRHTTEPVTFKYSKPIKKGKSSKFDGRETGRQFDELYNEQTRDSSTVKDGEVLEKTIHSYRMWFLFLKMGLELEQQKTILVMKEKVRLENGKYTKRVIHKIKVNKKKYEEWDLDEVLTSNFDDWWFGRNGCKSHRYLFVSKPSTIIQPTETVSNDENKVTIEFDKRSTLKSVINQLRDLNNEQKIFQKKTKDKFSINGRIRYLTLLNRYNCLLLKLEDVLTNKEILTHEHQYIRPTNNKTKDGYAVQKEVVNTINTYGEVNYGITIFDLISGTKKSFGAKQILLSVCDGYFLKHPTKTYL